MLQQGNDKKHTGSGNERKRDRHNPHGWKVTLPGAGDLVRSGYEFGGWYDGKVHHAGEEYPISSVTLKALWEDRDGLSFVDFVSVPGGTFTQESTAGEKFTHTVSGFKLGRYQVTYERWKYVYDWAINNGYQFSNRGWKGGLFYYQTLYENLEDSKYQPVIMVSWRDAIVWCNAYSEMEGKTPVYFTDAGFTTPLKDSRDGSYGDSVNTTAGSFDNPFVNWLANGYRLPTEGEWQYAASYTPSANIVGT